MITSKLLTFNLPLHICTFMIIQWKTYKSTTLGKIRALCQPLRAILFCFSLYQFNCLCGQTILDSTVLLLSHWHILHAGNTDVSFILASALLKMNETYRISQNNAVLSYLLYQNMLTWFSFLPFQWTLQVWYWKLVSAVLWWTLYLHSFTCIIMENAISHQLKDRVD